MIRRPPRSTRTDTLFPTRRSSDLFERPISQCSIASPSVVLWMVETSRWINPPRSSSPRMAKRSEEHTSELQSLMRISYAVFCLKKTKKQQYNNVSTDKLPCQGKYTKTDTLSKTRRTPYHTQ